MEDNMVEKYQQHYNQLVSSTLTDAIMKSISYQANIKLANEIISEQEKTISDLKTNLESFKEEKEKSESAKILNLESTLKLHNETINKLNSEVINFNKIKSELESLRIQSTNVDTFRKELIKERELHSQTKTNYEKKIKELTDKIDLLESPPKKKKITKSFDNSKDDDKKVTEETTKDGGNF